MTPGEQKTIRNQKLTGSKFVPDTKELWPQLLRIAAPKNMGKPQGIDPGTMLMGTVPVALPPGTRFSVPRKTGKLTSMKFVTASGNIGRKALHGGPLRQNVAPKQFAKHGGVGQQRSARTATSSPSSRRSAFLEVYQTPQDKPLESVALHPTRADLYAGGAAGLLVWYDGSTWRLPKSGSGQEVGKICPVGDDGFLIGVDTLVHRFQRVP